MNHPPFITILWVVCLPSKIRVVYGIAIPTWSSCSETPIFHDHFPTGYVIIWVWLKIMVQHMDVETIRLALSGSGSARTMAWTQASWGHLVPSLPRMSTWDNLQPGGCTLQGACHVWKLMQAHGSSIFSEIQIWDVVYGEHLTELVSQLGLTCKASGSWRNGLSLWNNPDFR